MFESENDFEYQGTSWGIRTAERVLQQQKELRDLHAAGVKKAKAYLGKKNLKLHVGCGSNSKAGWINIDTGEAADLMLDMRERLPFADGSVSIVYSEHFFEHLHYTGAHANVEMEVENADSPSEALSFLRESLRVLEPGGVFSVVVPDAEMMLRAYVGGDEKYRKACVEEWHPRWCAPAFMHSVNYTFRQGTEHGYAYDSDTLCSVIASVGFERVQRRNFDPALDTEERAYGSLFVEARKPR